MTKGVVTEPRRSSRQKALKVKEESKPITLHEYDSDVSSDLSSVPDDFEGRGVGITLKAEEPNPTVPSSALDSQHHGWNHPSELEYLTPSDWSDTQIMHHLIAHSFDIPSQKPHGGTPFVEFTSVDGSTTVLPSGYRVPLMLFMRFQWDTLKLVLSSSNSVTTREAQWNLYKYPLLHISRLCKTLLQQAQDSLGGFDVDLDSGVTKRKPKQEGINKWWRCDTFDRALVRYKMKWVIVEGDKAKFEAKVKEFWEKYGEKEFKRDVLKCSWRKSALAGHHGFALTENEIQNGITAKELMDGLKEKDGKWCWETSPNANGGTDAWTLRKTASKSSRFAAPAPSTLTSMTSTVVNQQLGSISSLGHTPTSSASRKRHGCSLEREGVAKKARKVTATSSKKLVEPVAQPFPSTCPPLQVKVVGERDIVEPHSDILEIEIGNKPDSLRSRSDAAASRPLATSARSAPSCRQPNVRLLRREDFILPEARDLQEKLIIKNNGS
ncbi:hypothetical protein V5O48_011707 [Marasmius crinis-equi]|uniref:Uncharacterized protein n=1 Tax=Marasmius crinis-equi TaxID=585013 RepID=A0ABR3F4T6_9AGAR